MKKKLAVAILLVHFCGSVLPQNSVKGTIVDGWTEKPIKNVYVELKGTGKKLYTNDLGYFLFSNVKDGNFVLQLELQGYKSQNFNIALKGKPLDLGVIYLLKESSIEDDVGLVSITDDELNSDDGFTDNITGLLQSSKDVFYRAAAFDFGTTFFRPRGLDNANGKFLLNGIEMNKMHNGRPQWANWGGTNHLQKNQSFTMGVTPNDLTFGGIAGVNVLSMRASELGPKIRISFASSNRSYRKRIMASYSSGVLKNGWSYALLGSQRIGEEGFLNGTGYHANSFFVSIEKKIGNDHSLNANLIYTTNRRGRATAITKEVFELKGRQYNPLWGELNGAVLNSRERNIVEPILMLNYYWKASNQTQLNVNISYQTGFIGNTRIDNGGTDLMTDNSGLQYISGGARNPLPNYWQNLPSFFLRDANLTPYDFQNAYLAEQEFIKNGQMAWSEMININQRRALLGKNAVYALQENRSDDSQLSMSAILNTTIHNRVKVNASIAHRTLQNETYAKLKNLLGGTGFLDVDFFAEELPGNDNGDITNLLAQSDVQQPNRIVQKGERYKYNYALSASSTDFFLQSEISLKNFDLFAAATYNMTHYQRMGRYENGNFLGSASLGKSEQLKFHNVGFKTGLVYKITGQHVLSLNTSYMTKAPTMMNAFENPRQNNFTVKDIDNEQIQNYDLSYFMRTPFFNLRLTGYLILLNEGTDVNFFFTETGNTFKQEIVTAIEKRNMGIELGITGQVTPSMKLKIVAALGEFIYNDNPSVYYTSDEIKMNSLGDHRRTYGDGTAAVQNLRIAGGPQTAVQFGFEYRDPAYWWVGVTGNYFANSYVDPSILKRTAAFNLDFDLVNQNHSSFREGGNLRGFTFNDLDPTIAKQLLKQEKFDPFTLVNLSGGKSWRIGEYFVSLFATVNNVLNQVFKAGGFEQSRLIDYRSQIQEQSRPYGPLFGNRYFYGNGTTYFVNLSLSF